jgi:ribonuclease R
MKNMIESEIISLLRKRREGLNFQRIVKELYILPEEKQLLRKTLKRLESLGVILRLKRQYFVPARSNILEGRFIASPRGYGFVSPERGSSEDIFIPARYAGGALNGDVVEVLYREKGKKGKPEGRVIRIVKKETEKMLGLYKERGGQAFFLPFDSPSPEEIPLTLEKNLSPQPGMIVEVDRDSRRLTDVLGMPDDPGVDTLVVIRRYNLASSFSEEVLAEAEECSAEIGPQDKKERKDYRNWKIVTIDGASAQDFDDAVSIRKIRNGHFLLGVHIADVSRYVKPDTALDAGAYERGTSVYFPDLTLPMLPERLSNDICSLRPQQERFTFSVLIEINQEGEVLKTEFHPSLIRTAARMTYDSVYRIFEGDEEETEKFSDLVPDLMLMRDLARLLRARRVKEGSLDFDLVEPELVYKEGSLDSIVPFEHNEAHQVIEEFMLAANEAVASFLGTKRVSLIYRIHPAPALKDLEKLREILAHFGLALPRPGKISSRDLQQVLNEVEGEHEEKFINRRILRSLKLAVYSEENRGHYGLAKKEYTHFTSPIRRYPDLIVHRILKKVLRQERAEIPSLSSIALHCSQEERKAEEAERELVEWRIFRFLKGKLGDEFEGMIVDISKAGLIVELRDYFVDGLVSYSDLGGDYYFRRSEKTLVGRRTGRKYELGDGLNVVLASVDPILRRMSLVPSPGRKEEAR